MDAWLAHALAAHRGHYRDSAGRDAAVSLPTTPVLAHADLLGELLGLVPDAGGPAFAARPDDTDPEARDALAGFLAR